MKYPATTQPSMGMSSYSILRGKKQGKMKGYGRIIA